MRRGELSADRAVADSTGPSVLSLNGKPDRQLRSAADSITEHTFSTVPEGYAPHEVNACLAALSEQLRVSAERERALRERLETDHPIYEA